MQHNPGKTIFHIGYTTYIFFLFRNDAIDYHIIDQKQT